MNSRIDNLKDPATGEMLRRAVGIFIEHAYGPAAPEELDKFVLPEDLAADEWLMSDVTERTPPDATVEHVRSFAMRIGNRHYPNMKLRLSRPPQQRVYLFSVDCHDAFLQAPVGSPDHEELEELKRRNAELASAIGAAWEQARPPLPTEHSYLRDMIRNARNRAPRTAADG